MIVIGISGSRCVGKDTFYRILKSLNPLFVRYAMADELKHDLSDFVKRMFSIDLLNASGKDKELVRPIMISYGSVWRSIDIDHWVKKVILQIDAQSHTDDIPVITDLRYENELSAFRSKYGSQFFHIHITRDDGVEAMPDEKQSLDALSPLADLHVIWGNNTFDEMCTIVHSVYKKMNFG
jgi:hypothetical protein